MRLTKSGKHGIAGDWITVQMQRRIFLNDAGERLTELVRRERLDAEHGVAEHLQEVWVAAIVVVRRRANRRVRLEEIDGRDRQADVRAEVRGRVGIGVAPLPLENRAGVHAVAEKRARLEPVHQEVDAEGPRGA